MARANLFVAASRMEASAEEVFRWHAEPGALERLTPPWERVEMIERAAGIRDGDRGAMWVYMGPMRLRWTFEHSGYIEGRQFRDVQTVGAVSPLGTYAFVYSGGAGSLYARGSN